MSNVHLPLWPAITQRACAERQVAMMTQPLRIPVAGIIAGGDFDSFGRDGTDPATELLAALPEYLRPGRLRRGRAGNYDVYEHAAAVGMKDAALLAGPGLRDPGWLQTTGANGGGRVDHTRLRGVPARERVWQDQVNTRGTDLEVYLVTLRPGEPGAGRVMGWHAAGQ